MIFKALLVVQEAVHGAADGPQPMTVGLRFALAYLFATAEKPDLDQFKRFAKCIANPHGSQTEYMGNYMRGTEARGHLSAFMAMMGIEPSIENESKLRTAFCSIADVAPANAPDGTPRI